MAVRTVGHLGRSPRPEIGDNKRIDKGMMKKLIGVGVLLLVLVGCRSDDVVSSGVDDAASPLTADFQLLREHNPDHHLLLK